MFSPLHLAALLLSALLVFLCCRWARRWDAHATHRFFRITAIVMLFFDPTYWTWEFLSFGTIDLAMSLPLYICSLFWMLLPVAVYARDGACKRCAISCLSTVGMLGGVMGLVFNTHVGVTPFFGFVTMYSLIYHFLIVLITALLWATGYYQPRRSDRYLCMVPVILLVLVNIPLSYRFGWDYCFTAGGIGTPFDLVSRHLPRPVFLILLYGGLTLLLGKVFYPGILRSKAVADCAKE